MLSTGSARIVNTRYMYCLSVKLPVSASSYTPISLPSSSPTHLDVRTSDLNIIKMYPHRPAKFLSEGTLTHKHDTDTAERITCHIGVLQNACKDKTGYQVCLHV